MATLNLGRIKPVFKGAYSGSTAYVIDDIVTHGNETFICIQAHGAGTQATSVTAYWTKMAAKGGDVTQLTTQGDILYRDGSGVARLAAGASGQALLSGGAGANVSWGTVDLEGIKSDITALAIREATNENSAAFNLPSSFIETFTDDTNLGTQTTGDRDSGSWQTIIPADGVDANTVMMLHFETDTSSAVVDSSSNSGDITFTKQGSGNTDTAQYKFGSRSWKNEQATSDWLQSSDVRSGLTNAFPTTGDFTIDWWARASTSETSNRHWCFNPNGTPSSGAEPALTFSCNSPNAFNIHSADGSWSLVATTAAFENGVWHHFALQRTGTNLHSYMDGVIYWVSSGQTFFSGSDLMRTGSSFSGQFYVGARSNNTSEYYRGWIDELRISKVARYASSAANAVSVFTPRTTAYESGVSNATGTLIQSANAVSGSRTKVGGTMCYKDNAGTNTLGTDLRIYFSADNSNWTEAASYNAITPVYSTGVKMVRLGETTVTGGTDVRYKAVFANQASGSKEAQLHAIGINY